MLIVIVAALVALVLWRGKKKAVETLPATAVETNATLPSVTVPVSIPVDTNAAIVAAASIVPPPPQSKEQQMREGLAELNDVRVEFYGRLEDQFANPVGNAQIKFEIPFNNGNAVGVNRGTTIADGNGFFTISGYNGKSLDVVPAKSGYVLASLNGGGIYSYLWPESQRVQPDRNNPTVIRMWKLQGAEPLVDISKEYKLPYIGTPISFDLVAGEVVSSGGDLKITVNRPAGEISEHNPQLWNIDLEVVDGGFIETSGRESAITFAAPEDGYQPSGTFRKNNGPNLVDKAFFLKSRHGQVFSKFHLWFRINDKPDDSMHVRFGGVANTNSSRNWEATASPQ